MELNQIITDLQKKIYKPVYFLIGEEPYFMDIISDYIANNVLTEAERSFNQTILYATPDMGITTVIDTARRFPMMANYQVVIVKEAHNIKDIGRLSVYVSNPLKSTILVVCYKHKTLDKRKKETKELMNSLQMNGVFYESKKLYDNKIPGWITGHVREKNRKIGAKAASMLADFLGNDLQKISNEIDKLLVTLPPGHDLISEEHIEENIGISKEYNNFELLNALMEKNILKANRIIDYFDRNPKNNPAIVTLVTIYSFFVKLLIIGKLKNKSDLKAIASMFRFNEYIAKDYLNALRNYPETKLLNNISYLREYNMKMVGVNNSTSTDGELMRELIFRILH